MSNKPQSPQTMGIMQSRVSDLVAEDAMLSGFAPRTLTSVETESFSQQITSLERSLAGLATIGAEIRHAQYSNSVSGGNATQKVIHSHIVQEKDSHLTAGAIRFKDLVMKTEISDKEVSYKGSLESDIDLTIEVVTSYDESSNPIWTTIISRRMPTIVANVVVNRLANACFFSLGSLAKEISSSIYKSSVDKGMVPDEARAAIMRLQDNKLQQLCEKAASANISDGVGPLIGSTVVEGNQIADELSIQLVSIVAPIIYNWAFKGKALGTAVYNVRATKG